MKTKYDIGDKVVIVAVVNGMQMYVDDKCPLYTLRVYDTSGYNSEVHLTETVLDKNGLTLMMLKRSRLYANTVMI